jgi:ubiquitin C-terminal hydrolase
MFGLPNVRGSCWVNGALQCFFACPPVRERFSKPLAVDASPLEKALWEVYTSQGKHGLQDVFHAVQTQYMPAGKNIGDSHELLVFLSDALPWLDGYFRYKLANAITCTHCKTQSVREESVMELDIHPAKENEPLLESITHSFQPETLTDWKCEACKGVGCTSQRMFGSFPKILMLHKIGKPMEYSSVLVMNNHKYILFGVLCYNGAHWWTYARQSMGHPWFRLDDSRVEQLATRQFPVTSAMNVLLYFLLEN